MPYIGNQPGTGVRSRFIYTATASQTTFTGADDNSKTLKYADSAYVDVFLNGVCLVPGTDYTASTKTSIVLTQAASVSDTLEVVAYDIATISDTVSKADGGTFNGDLGITNASPDITLTNNTTEDTDGGRESTVTFKGLQSGGEESTLAEIRASHDATADDQKGDLIFRTNDGSDGASPTERMRIDSGGNVGIGTSSPNQLLEVANSSGGATISISTDEAAGSTGSKKYNNLDFTGYNNTVLARIQSWDESSSTGHGYLTFHTFPSGGSLTERARIDNSGNVLVAKTVTDGSVVGHELRAMGQAIHTASGDVPVIARRMSNDGDVVLIQGQSGTVGFIGIKSSKMVLVSGSVGIGVGDDNAFPTSGSGASTDNVMDMGDSSARWQDVFSANGVTTTSDENEKQQITSLTSSEVTAAKAISKLFKTYKWNDAVTAKGDDARTHTGVIAQQVQTAMTDAGLDASKYGFWCSDTWWETHTEVAAVEADEENGIEAKDAYTDRYVYKTEDEAPEGATKRTRKGIRYPELLSFVGAATEQRLTSIEARLTALEAG